MNRRGHVSSETVHKPAKKSLKTDPVQKMWARKKKEQLGVPSKDLEKLKISRTERTPQENEDAEPSSKTLKLQRGKYNLDPEEFHGLMETVFKPRNADQEALKTVLKALVRAVLEESIQKEHEDSEEDVEME